MPDFSDPKVVNAVEMYIRLAVGTAFMAVLLYMFATERIDIDAVVKAVLSLLAIDRTAIGLIGVLRKNQNNS
jgi:hypothetical protein